MFALSKRSLVSTLFRHLFYAFLIAYKRVLRKNLHISRFYRVRAFFRVAYDLLAWRGHPGVRIFD